MKDLFRKGRAAQERNQVSKQPAVVLRKQARERIELHIAEVGKRLKRAPNRIYVMGQRTKWGNCSARCNLSFNWRLVMAPDFVLRYIVTHEMVSNMKERSLIMDALIKQYDIKISNEELSNEVSSVLNDLIADGEIADPR